MPKLLLVDDDQDLVSGLTKYLTGQGYVVEAAFTGRDTLQLLENFTFGGHHSGLAAW